MIKIKNSYSKKHPVSNHALERHLSVIDSLGRKGIDVFEKEGFKIVYGKEKADIGLSSHGFKVQGVPKEKTILMKTEPPIYYAIWGRNLSNSKFLKKYMTVMSTTIEKDLDQYHFVIPQDFSLGEFNGRGKHLLCMILKNKKRIVNINNLFSSLRKYKDNSLLYLREVYHNYFNYGIGEKNYHAFGEGWDGICYKGTIDNIYDIIRYYQFNFCPENSRFEGYVTEKPINSMLCGSIPIYLGAYDIEKYIPKNCFIHILDFKDAKELATHIKYMDKSEYQTYRKNMKEFITTDKSKAFSSVTFAKKLIKIIEEKL